LGFAHIPNVKIHILCKKVERIPLEMFPVPLLYFQKSTSFRESDKQNSRQYGVLRLKIFSSHIPEYRGKVMSAKLET